ncbi:MAG: hypothetical protein F6K48_30065 [Okeania sp. SIO3H1]|nr:hypothetical protein [Okeania sp. SIO1I7]NEN92909.1 hypothetical protein [Okeania sp. SIO3H1]NET28487.1 hypothetical protein [Okeania sp. SIO1I7]
MITVKNLLLISDPVEYLLELLGDIGRWGFEADRDFNAAVNLKNYVYQ